MRDWGKYLHTLRSHEFSLVFSRFPKKAFGRVLEVGAGDGFQTELLAPFAWQLISSDFDTSFVKRRVRGVSYRDIDAERLTSAFTSEDRFDLIYSSNLMEHLRDPHRFLAAVHGLLADDGITIHIMPNPFWKACQLSFYHFHVAVRLAGYFSARLRGKDADGIGRGAGALRGFSNNPKSSRQWPLWKRLFLPPPHGEYVSHLEEFLKYRKRRWIGEFNDAGFSVVRVLKGPVSSGYGFGFDHFRVFLEKIGFSSEYVYVAVKKGSHCPAFRYFENKS